MTDGGLLDLADVLARLGAEFRRAAQTPDPTIQWYGGTVELQAVVTRDAEGKLRFWVAEGGGGVTHQQTIRVTVQIGPYLDGPAVGGK